MKEIAKAFTIHCATVSRVVKMEWHKYEYKTVSDPGLCDRALLDPALLQIFGRPPPRQ